MRTAEPVEISKDPRSIEHEDQGHSLEEPRPGELISRLGLGTVVGVVLALLLLALTFALSWRDVPTAALPTAPTDPGEIAGDSPDGSDRFVGTIDVLRVYRVARSGTEICLDAGGGCL